MGIGRISINTFGLSWPLKDSKQADVVGPGGRLCALIVATLHKPKIKFNEQTNRMKKKMFYTVAHLL